MPQPEMDSVGNVLALLHGARDTFSTVKATVRVWHNVERLNEALSRWARLQTPGSVSVLKGEHRGPQRQQIQLYEQTSRLWVQKPSRSRLEYDLEGGQGAAVKIVDGPLWWSYNPQIGALTNEGAGEPERLRDHGDDHPFVELFDPSRIIPTVSIEAAGRSMQAGREAIRVRALPRDIDVGPSRLWHGADEYELHVDLESGVLLRVAVRTDGEEFAAREITVVAFDEELPDEVFTFRPPPGVRVRHVGQGGLIAPRALLPNRRWWPWARHRWPNPR